MRQDLIAKLLGTYPHAFANECALSCGDGWYDLVRCVVHDIEQREDPEQKVVIVHARNKIGQIYIGFKGHGDYERGLSAFATYMSQFICEECGERGVIRDVGGAVYVRCDTHYQSLLQEIE